MLLDTTMHSAIATNRRRVPWIPTQPRLSDFKQVLRNDKKNYIS
ncbi:hypothetical protein [Coleofasciculus sp.]